MLTHQYKKEDLVTLGHLTEKYFPALTDILNSDTLLQEALGTSRQTTVEECVHTHKRWVEKNHGAIYIILLQGVPIGTISISPTEVDAVKIGYWIQSQQWGKGYGTQAFRQALQLAREQGAKVASAIIPKSAVASYKMWGRVGATFTQQGASFKASVTLE